VHEKKIISTDSYKPTGGTFPTTKQPMSTYWKAIEPSVYLTLFAWLAPIKEGRNSLQEFAAKADPSYAHPTYLAYVVLNPVRKIVNHIIDISRLETILHKDNKHVKNAKYRHTVTAYIAGQYLAALVYESTTRKEIVMEDNDYIADNIGEMKGMTEILLNLPREYQRWNKEYKKAGSLKSDGPEVREDPFNTACRLHPTFQQWSKFQTTETNNTKTKFTLKLDPAWDPLILAKAILDASINITVKDMYDGDVCQYENGKIVKLKARGKNTAKKISTASDEWNSTNVIKTTKTDRSIDTTNKVKAILCNNMKKHFQPLARTSKITMDFCNDIAMDVTQCFTGERPAKPLITADDVKDNTSSGRKKRKNMDQDDK
jgi:hypothetical protein